MIICANFDATLPSWAGSMYPIEEICETEEEIIELPDFSIDPETRCLQAINNTSAARVVTVSLEGCVCRGVESAEFIEQGFYTRPGNSEKFPVTTFIVLAPPKCVIELCIIEATESIEDVVIDSHVGAGYAFTDAGMEEAYCMSVFPLQGNGHSFHCTQASGGAFTHFQHPSTYHAVDFRCLVGTPVIAVEDGVVTAVKVDSQVTGVHVKNLFEWNSIVLKTDSGYLIEYVHIHYEGVAVSVGDRVVRGQVICLSGEAGFCPEPHLHLEVHRGCELDAPSLPIEFHGNFFKAGSIYP